MLVRVDTWGVTQLPPYALSRALLAKKISPTNATSATIHVLDGSQSEEAHVQQTLGALLGCAHILFSRSRAQLAIPWVHYLIYVLYAPWEYLSTDSCDAR